jgi:hypothetical protein
MEFFTAIQAAFSAALVGHFLVDFSHPGVSLFIRQFKGRFSISIIHLEENSRP